MTTARLGFKSLLATAALACAFIGTATSADAQQRRSILERYATYQEFEQRRFGFMQNGYRNTDLETCREPDGGAVWWVAVYDLQPTPETPAGFGHYVESGSWTGLMQETGQLALQGWFIDDLDAASDGSGWSHYVAIFNEWPNSNQHIIRETSFSLFNEIRLDMNGAGLRLVDPARQCSGQPQSGSDPAALRPGRRARSELR